MYQTITKNPGVSKSRTQKSYRIVSEYSSIPTCVARIYDTILVEQEVMPGFPAAHQVQLETLPENPG